MSFNIGEIEGQFDSAMSIGASWSMADRDRDLVGINNGGFTQTGDDGRLNFKKGETFSKIFRVCTISSFVIAIAVPSFAASIGMTSS